MLLPTVDGLRQLSSLDVAGFMEPAEEVDGDHYDVVSRHWARSAEGI